MVRRPIRCVEVGSDERRSSKVRPRQIGLAQIRIRESCFLDVGSGQILASEVPARQVIVLEIDALPDSSVGSWRSSTTLLGSESTLGRVLKVDARDECIGQVDIGQRRVLEVHVREVLSGKVPAR